MAYLGLIEARTNELLRVYSAARDAEKAAERDAGGDLAEGSVTSTANATSSVLGTGPQVPMGTVRELAAVYTHIQHQVYILNSSVRVSHCTQFKAVAVHHGAVAEPASCATAAAAASALPCAVLHAVTHHCCNCYQVAAQPV
jgi:hypothetical protein